MTDRSAVSAGPLPPLPDGRVPLLLVADDMETPAEQILLISDAPRGALVLRIRPTD